jgi:hypothetical protein
VAVTLRTALHAHLAIAEALADLWVELPHEDRKTIHDDLGRWHNANHKHTSADDHVAYLRARLSGEIAAEASDALVSAAIRGEQALDDIYRAVRGRVCALYGAHTVVDTGAVAPLEVEVQRKVIFSEAILGGFGASARYGPDPTTGLPSLILTICPKLLGPPTLASVPYVLCHELVCHAFQGAVNSDEDSFAEGWMDQVALSLHDEWSDHLFPRAPQLARDAADALSSYLREDALYLDDSYGKTRDARRLGWAAAEEVERFLRGHDDAPPSLFHKLSIQLNVLPDFDFRRRRAFVAAVRAASKEFTRRAKRDAVLLQWKERQIGASELVSGVIGW